MGADGRRYQAKAILHPKPAKRPVLPGFFEMGQNETREVDVAMETPEAPKCDPRTESSQAKGLN